MNVKYIYKFSNIVRFILFLPWTLLFNFRYLPFKVAIKLPIIFYVRPTFERLSGQVQIKSDNIKFNMIKLGKNSAPMLPYKRFIWENRGLVIFKGKVGISHHTFICVGPNGTLIFGNNSTYSFGCRFIAFKKIEFGEYTRVSWDCTFIDTDFHPIVDTISKSVVKPELPIIIDYGSWIGYNVIISKGVKLAKNTIVSSGAIVKRRFTKENLIIGGNLAEIIDEGFIREDSFMRNQLK